MNESAHLWLIPLFPFLGFLLNGILGSRLPRRLVSVIGVLAPLVSFAIVLNDFGATIISAAVSCPSCGQVTALALPAAEALPFHWIAIGALQVDFTLVLDQLSAVMLLVVTGVGFLIHIYSLGYMRGEPGYARYFSFLNLFLFFMSVLVLAGNFLVMFVGWEGVGLASYLLIGFYLTAAPPPPPAKKPSSSTASAILVFSLESSSCSPPSARSTSAASLSHFRSSRHGPALSSP